MSFGARAHIRLDAISHNLATIRALSPGARIMAVIKANAYGHGLTEVAATLAAVDCLAVARLHEAVTLREAGIDTPIALLGGVLAEADLDQALGLELQIGVHNELQIDWLERSAKSGAVVWLKVDTGMHRLGFDVEEAAAQLARLRNCPAVGSVRVMSHFANADDRQDTETLRQVRRFSDVIRDFDGDISIANSPGIFGWSAAFSVFSPQQAAGRWWVRPGLSLYGVSPFADQCGADLGLRPAMDFLSRLTAVKSLRQGAAVGYGGDWRTPRDTMLGIVAAGYGDGYPRFVAGGAPVLVNGRRVPLAGRVSMDLAAVDLGPGAAERVGDPVVLWGSGLPVEEVARHAGTIPYQLLCGITRREPPRFDR